ncbi:MAG: UbiA-like polyprenyltransferase [Syntrophothermus sp.]
MIFHKDSKVADYFSLVKISHSVFALPFALIGFSMAVKQAPGALGPKLLALVVLCVFFARNAAMGFNRWADRVFDSKNPRTAIREIPKNIIRPGSALLFVILNSVLFITCTYFINRICFYLSPVALLVVLGYSLTKRFTFLSHVVLGLALSLAPLGAWLAVTGYFAWIPVIFSLIVIFWVAGFDIIYALQDDEFDRSQNLRSIPASFGRKKALVISAFFHLISIVLVVIAGIHLPSGMLYWGGTIIFSGILVYEHLVVKPDDLSKVNLAFATMNGMASIIFAVMVILDIFIK